MSVERITFLEGELDKHEKAIANINQAIATGRNIRNGAARLVRRKVQIASEILALRRMSKEESHAA